MRTIKMLTTAAGPGGTYQQGQTVTVKKELAAAFVQGGFAEYEGGPPIIEPEIATIEPRERAVMPQGKAKKKG